MTHARSILFGAAVMALAGTTVAAAHAASADERRAYRVIVTQGNQIDNAPAGFGVGDVLVFSGPIIDEGGASIGRVDGQCTVTTNQGQAYCTPVLSLSEGQILLAGSRSVVELQGNLAIVGGTGRYRNARGDAIAHDDDLTHTKGSFELNLR